MIDAPGPWGTGPYTLVEGFSSLENEIGLIQAEPLTCVWLDTGTPRSERVVLEANRDHWNSERGRAWSGWCSATSCRRPRPWS